jgi:20S proteasome subunit beta 1
MMMSTGMLGEDGIHIDMNHLKKGEVNLGTSMFVFPERLPLSI